LGWVSRDHVDTDDPFHADDVAEEGRLGLVGVEGEACRRVRVRVRIRVGV
jgi:hypothetical protein